MSPVAETIFAQMGGHKMAVMTGVKQRVFTDSSLALIIGSGAKQSIKRVNIILDQDDTYTMEFVNNRGNLKASHSGVYCDMLQDIFTQETGFYTKF
jgi:hypothetical protein